MNGGDKLYPKDRSESLVQTKSRDRPITRQIIESDVNLAIHDEYGSQERSQPNVVHGRKDIGSGRSVFHLAHQLTPNNGYTPSSSPSPSIAHSYAFFHDHPPVVGGCFGIGREQTRPETELLRSAGASLSNPV